MTDPAAAAPAMTWLSPKTEKRPSRIQGTGLFAAQAFARGEVVAVKGGCVYDRATHVRLPAALADSEVQIGADLFIGPLREADRAGSMMHLNHSCDPNVGLRGEITFAAMRDVAAGEELTLDYAMFDDLDYTLACRCGAPDCRKTVTGQDWRRPELQARYRGWFSRYLAERIGR